MVTRRFSQVLALALASGIALGAGDASARPPVATAAVDPADDAPAASSTSAAKTPLPKLAPLVAPDASPEATKDLQRILDLLTSAEAKTRESGRAAIKDATPAMVGAVRARVAELRTALDREQAPTMLDDIRRAGRKTRKPKGDGDEKADKKKKEKASSDDDGGDWLDFLVEQPKPRDKTWRHLVELVAMNRILAQVGNTPAVRELIAMHSYFGDLLRIDVTRQVLKLRDKAVPALIEARQHDAKVIQRWASRQLDVLGKAIPGEAVSTSDTQIVADVLRAYGRTREVDAVRVMLSYSNSERLELREAARESLGAIGEPATWQLREAYLSMTGQKAPKDWAWDRIARELFSQFDKARLAEVWKAMDEGAALAKKAEHAKAVEAFDRVLARAPLFERRREMAPSYVALARELEAKDAKAALELYRKALRIDPKADDAKKTEAAVAYLEAMELAGEGRPDKFLLERVLELDPAHDGAKAAIANLSEAAVARQSRTRSYAAAGATTVIALAAMLFLWRGKKKPAPAAKKPEPKAAHEPPPEPEPAPAPAEATELADEPEPARAPVEPTVRASEPPARPPATALADATVLEPRVDAMAATVAAPDPNAATQLAPASADATETVHDTDPEPARKHPKPEPTLASVDATVKD